MIRTSWTLHVKSSLPRGELEITDVNKVYLDAGKLHVADGAAASRAGTPHPRFAHGGGHVCAGYRNPAGLKFPALEEIAWRKGYISTEQLMKLAAPLQKSGYGTTS